MNVNNFYLITEYSSNGSLRDVLRSRLLKDRNELLLICKQISPSVEYLHRDFCDRNNIEMLTRPSIAHRDLKSENIQILAGSIGYETNALGIIFWEILSRVPTEDSNEIYEMPYENQLRSHNFNLNPSINEMLQIMNFQIPFSRPLIRSSWKQSSNEYLNEICSTMEECWDQNPAGRIRALLVALRTFEL